MARKRNKNNNQNDTRKNDARKNDARKEFKKQGGGSDLKPTRCSMCRFAKDSRTNNLCYQRAKLRPELEYVDCIPAMIHYSEKKLSALHLI